jgi:hypothetical protein
MIRTLVRTCVACLGCGGAVLAQTTYDLLPIAPPNPGFLTQPFSLNSLGDVALTTGNGQPIGIAWVVGPSGTRLLTPLAGQPSALPIKISDSGRVLGGSGPDIPSLHASIWNPLGQVRELRLLRGDFVGFPLDATGGGWAVGLSSDNYGVTDLPVLWVQDVLVPLDLPPGYVYGGAYGINSANTIVGAGWTADQSLIEGWIRFGLGGPSAIGQYPGHIGNQLVAINTKGVAVGGSIDDASTQYGLLYEHGVMTVFPPFAGHTILSLFSVNRAGVSVGIDADPTGFPYAVVEEAGQTYWLNDLLNSPNGWQLLIAQEINNAGQIACAGLTPQGAIGACVLTPAPAPDGQSAKPRTGPIRPALPAATEHAVRMAVARTLELQGPLGARAAAALAAK